VRSRPELSAAASENPPQPPHTLDIALSFLRHAPVGVLAVDREGRILSVNGAAARLLGYAPDEIEGEASARFFRAPRGEGHVPPGACAQPEPAREVEVVTRSGDILPVSLRLLPLEGPEGTLLGTPRQFAKHGRSGIEVSDLFPNLANFTKNA